MVAFSLAQNEFKGDEVILFISPHFKNSKNIIQRLCENSKNVFKEVVILDDHFGTKKYVLIRKFRFIFFYKKAIKLCERCKFQKFIFFPGNLIIASLFAKYICKHNHQCEFAFGDDGLASYINHDEYTKLSGKQKRLLILLNYQQYLKRYRILYVMEPDLVVTNKHFMLRKITHPDFKNTEFRMLMKKVFVSALIPQCDILYLQQPFIYDSNQFACFEKVQSKSIRDICSICRKKKIYIKIHPRTPENYKIPDNIVRVKGKGLFEASLTSDINQSVLVTLFSTAAFTPFMLWGLTPKIILLYKIANESILTSNLALFLKKFKKVYNQNGGKIYEPENWDQFEYYLNLVK